MFNTLKDSLPADSPFVQFQAPQDKVVMKDLHLDTPPQPNPQAKEEEEEIVVKSEPLSTTQRHAKMLCSPP